MFVDYGAHFTYVHFTNVLATDGDLMPMADQVRRAVAWIFENAANFGGDPNRIHVAGHSSGGQLAGVVLTTDWPRDFGLPIDIVKGGLCSSGMYYLYPVSLSARSSYVSFSPQVVEELSSLRHLDKLVAPVVVTHGTLETPEFQRQNREFASAVRAAGKPVQFLIGEGYNHFEILETFSDPYGLLGRAAVGADESRNRMMSHTWSESAADRDAAHSHVNRLSAYPRSGASFGRTRGTSHSLST